MTSQPVPGATASAGPRPTPRGASGRLHNLDVLRGVAILGTLGTNIWLFTLIGEDFRGLLERLSTLRGKGVDLTSRFAAYDPFSDLDSSIDTISSALTNGKFLAMLSLLFGVGMAILFDSARRRGHRWPLRYWWRSAILVLVGLAHYLFVVQFDVLMGYALTAILVAPLLLLRGRLLAMAGAATAVLHLVMEVRRYRQTTGDATDGFFDVELQRAYADFTTGSYLQQVQFRWEYFWDGREEAFQVAPPLTATLMVLGAGLWRAGVFTDHARSRRLRWALAVGGLGVGLPLTYGQFLPTVPDDIALIIGSFDRYTIAPVVMLGYLGVGLLLLERFPMTWLSRRLSAVGRTALSCYMLQNVIASVAFLGWGLNLGPLDGVGTVLAWAVISALLIIGAELWLRRFTTGPFEIVWRWLSDAPFRTRDDAVGTRQVPVG